MPAPFFLLFYLAALILVAAVIGVIVGKVLGLVWKPSPPKLKTRRIMSPAETSFYNFLKRGFGDKYIIAVKMPIQEVLKPDGKMGKELYSMYKNGHFDFVLTHPLSAEPVLAIELDDSTHNTPAARDRDGRKEILLAGAKLPIRRFKVGPAWGAIERQAILDAISNPSPTPTNSASITEKTRPTEQTEQSRAG